MVHETSLPRALPIILLILTLNRLCPTQDAHISQNLGEDSSLLANPILRDALPEGPTPTLMDDDADKPYAWQCARLSIMNDR
ncbi:hypothetical protein Tdes44962_MAKER09868 [Teratosphaeria destructans]|uniref:Secreted protein n=1 Tax=Teratosphaeria destructans TaxID=418781 RepID=A0A9W7W1P5_9PEZI|nr:hypothetical protein Tdes44962_MAKER09868 [Teratosphaeria destructans]